jgi:hypothetical protein
MMLKIEKRRETNLNQKNLAGSGFCYEVCCQNRKATVNQTEPSEFLHLSNSPLSGSKTPETFYQSIHKGRWK